MDRRSLLKTLLALPGVAAIAKAVEPPEVAPSPPTGPIKVFRGQTYTDPSIAIGPHRIEVEIVNSLDRTVWMADPLVVDGIDSDGRATFTRYRDCAPPYPAITGIALNRAEPGEKVRILIQGNFWQ